MHHEYFFFQLFSRLRVDLDNYTLQSPANRKPTTKIGCLSAVQSAASISLRALADTKGLQDNHYSNKRFSAQENKLGVVAEKDFYH